MQMHELRPTHPGRRKKRIGRGGKRGTYSGRGQKGQRARAGAKIKPMERELILRIPKRRGLGFPRPKAEARRIVALGDIEKHFAEGEAVTPKTLAEKGLLQSRGGVLPAVKLLGTAAVTKKLLVSGCQISAGARKAIEAAGGKVEEKSRE